MDRAVRALFAAPAGTVLLALGGYGRTQLSPGSDVDLLLVYDDGAARRGAEEAFERLLYPLWDAHLRLGHAVRTSEECRELAEERVDSLTALLSARHLAGSTRLLHQVRTTATALVSADRGAFVDALAEWRMQRQLRSGAIAESLEPDLKEALGGMRDLQLLHWLAAPAAGGGSLGEGFGTARARGLLDGMEERWARDGWRWLLLVREALQRATGDGTNRLSVAHHPGVAAALRYQDDEPSEGPVWLRADAMMRDLAVAARRAELATAAALDRARRAEPVRSNGPRRGSPLAAAAGALSAGLSPQRARVGPPGFRPRRSPWSRPERDALVELLAAGDRGSEWLTVLDAMGVLPEVLPEWLGVRGRPQRDPYHRHPVDAHLLRAAAEMARLLHRPDEPFAARAAAQVEDVSTPLLAALLHDVGKTGRRSHARLGVDVARSALDRIVVDERVRDDVLFLVGEHLLLGDTATRRDLHDEDLIVRIAATVGDPRRLAMLYLLTVADASATGPHAMTEWRLGLIRELVAKVDHVFERGLMDADRAAAVRAGEAAIRAALATEPQDRVERFLAEVPPAYVTWARPKDATEDLALLVPPPTRGEVRLRHRPGRIPGTEVVTIVAADRVGLLSDLAAAFALSRFSILSTLVFTTEGAIALDVFEVRTATGTTAGEEQWLRLEEELSHVSEPGWSARVGARVERLRRQFPAPGAGIPVEVRVDADASEFSTVVEVAAPDRFGLLFDLTGTLTSLGLDVHSARVATYGGRVVDVFYVTADGEPLGDPARIDELRSSLAAAARG